MKDLTRDRPKPLLEVRGRTLLEHKLSALPPAVEEVVITVGYHAQLIRDRLGGRFNGLSLRYVEQERLDGTGGALWRCRSYLSERFLVLMGDDLYGQADLAELADQQWAVGVKTVPWLEKGGRVLLNENRQLLDIIEGQHRIKNSLVNTGAFMLRREIFSYPLVRLPDREEYGLPQTVVLAAADQPVRLVEMNYWQPMTAPEDIVAAER